MRICPAQVSERAIHGREREVARSFDCAYYEVRQCSSLGVTKAKTLPSPTYVRNHLRSHRCAFEPEAFFGRLARLVFLVLLSCETFSFFPPFAIGSGEAGEEREFNWALQVAATQRASGWKGRMMTFCRG